jgi:hypothetical protein
MLTYIVIKIKVARGSLTSDKGAPKANSRWSIISLNKSKLLLSNKRSGLKLTVSAHLWLLVVPHLWLLVFGFKADDGDAPGLILFFGSVVDVPILHFDSGGHESRCRRLAIDNEGCNYSHARHHQQLGEAYLFSAKTAANMAW